MMTVKKSAWRGCLFGIALVLLGLAGCSKPPEPVQAPVVVEPVAAPEPVATDLLDIQIPTEAEVKNQALFKEYVSQLRAGDLMQSAVNLDTLKSRLKGENLNDPFWALNLPVEHRVILLIGALCSSCLDGACPTCKGQRGCQVCEGTGLCKDCEGKGGEWLMCQSCICKACNGTRLCSTCKGRRFLVCPSCNGSGNGYEEKKFTPCASCGGRGYKDGLKGPNGTSTRFKCLKCNGARGTYATIRYPCPACDGTGRKPCEACRATGVCPTCRGVGRMPDCPICHGQGRYLDPCPACKGEKACPVCSGSKLCQTCKGQGTCRDCLGHNLVIRYRVPIDRRWLAQPTCRVFHPGADGILSDPLTGTTVTLTIRSRAVSAEVPADGILWASAPEDLKLIKGLFIAEP